MSEKILIVDNDPKWQEILRIMLKPEKYDIFIADNYEEAIDILERYEFSLVTVNMNFSDIPGILDQLGFNLLEEILKNYPSLPRIVLTGYIEGPIFSRYLSLGVTEVLPKKGLNLPDFQKVVENCLASRRLPKGSHDFAKLCKILDKHLVNDHILQLIQMLRNKYPSERSFRSIHNLQGETKYQKISSILNVLESYGSVDVAFQMALKIKPEDKHLKEKIEEIDFSS